MRFFDWYVNRPVEIGEENSGELITTTLGYISPKRQIESILGAGVRLRRSREEEFHYPANSVVDDGYLPGNVYGDKLDVAQAVKDLIENVEDHAKESPSSYARATVAGSETLTENVSDSPVGASVERLD